MDEIKKNLGTEKLQYGFKQAVKGLKSGKAGKVFVANNCPELMLDDINYYANINGTEVETVDMNCDDLGTLCKKPFMISVITLVN